MFDRHIRPFIDPPAVRIAMILSKTRLTPNGRTIIVICFGIACGISIGFGRPIMISFALLVLSRLADGLDGPLARVKGTASDFGGFLDIECDFVFYSAVPLGFAFADSTNALPAACLFAGILLTAVSHLAFAVHAEKRGLSEGSQANKSFFFIDGLAEGTETIAVFTAMILWPAGFPVLAYGYGAWCVLSAISRTLSA
ncbi:MAG: CDP-alcohol phosphatidyltransferase family protein, partial [Sphingomonadales bacterium]